MTRLICFRIALYLALAGCGISTSDEQQKQVAAENTDTITVPYAFVPREDCIWLHTDVNGDGLQDTLIEDYKSGVSGMAMAKVLDSNDMEHNRDLITEQNAKSLLYTYNRPFDTLDLSRNITDQSGISYIEDLGDLDGDKGSELGYYLDYNGHSALNEYIIVSFKEGKWQRLTQFSINEHINFEPEYLYANKTIVQPIGNGKIAVRYYSDTATVEEKIIDLKTK